MQGIDWLEKEAGLARADCYLFAMTDTHILRLAHHAKDPTCWAKHDIQALYDGHEAPGARPSSVPDTANITETIGDAQTAR